MSEIRDKLIHIKSITFIDADLSTHEKRSEALRVSNEKAWEFAKDTSK